MSFYVRYGRPPSLYELSKAVARSGSPADRSYQRLRNGILTCKLAGGQRLDEQALAKKIGVSRPPLREAFRRLATEGLVKPSANGYYVAPITLEDMRNLCELRKIVESRVAALAAERATPAHVARLLAVAELDYLPGTRETYDHYLRSNSLFHAQLARTAGNARLEAVVMAVLDHLQRPLYLGLDVGLDRNKATSEHLELIDAIRRKRPALAARLMSHQIGAAEKRMIEALNAAGYGTKKPPAKARGSSFQRAQNR